LDLVYEGCGSIELRVSRENLEATIRAAATRGLYIGTKTFQNRTLYNDGTGLSEMASSGEEGSRSGSGDDSDSELDSEGASDGDEPGSDVSGSDKISGNSEGEESAEQDEEADNVDGGSSSNEGDEAVVRRRLNALKAKGKKQKKKLIDPFPDHPESLADAVDAARELYRPTARWIIPTWFHVSYTSGVGLQLYR
jgi:hypothetical protein